MDSWRRIAVCVGQALLYQQFGDLFAVARRFRAFAEHQAFGHSQTAEAASFQRALFTPGADEFLGPPHALAAQMRLHASRKVPPKPTRKLAGPGLVTIGRGNSPRGGGILTGHSA